MTTVDTANVLSKLKGLFDDVVSGRDYDEKQVKNATELTDTMVKVLRFEFNVYKHFAGRPKAQVVDHEDPATPPSEAVEP